MSSDDARIQTLKAEVAALWARYRSTPEVLVESDERTPLRERIRAFELKHAALVEHRQELRTRLAVALASRERWRPALEVLGMVSGVLLGAAVLALTVPLLAASSVTWGRGVGLVLLVAATVGVIPLVRRSSA